MEEGLREPATDLVIVSSYATLRHIARVEPEFSLDCACVIPQGISDEFHVYPPDEVRESICRLRLPSSYILYVGTIEPRKNLLRLLGGHWNHFRAAATIPRTGLDWSRTAVPCYDQRGSSGANSGCSQTRLRK